MEESKSVKTQKYEFLKFLQESKDNRVDTSMYEKATGVEHNNVVRLVEGLEKDELVKAKKINVYRRFIVSILMKGEEFIEEYEIEMESKSKLGLKPSIEKLKLENLVIENKLSEVLEKMKHNFPDLRKEITLHQSNLNEVKEKERKGLLDQHYIDLRIIKLKAAILELIEKVR